MTGQLERVLAWKKAEDQRKSGKIEEALAFFSDEFRVRPTADCGWRSAWCLRRLGRFEEARAMLDNLGSRFPDDSLVRSESAWLIYDTVVRPARDSQDYVALLEGARRMMETGADGLARQQAVFAGIKAARGLQVWEEVLALCEKLVPSNLQKSPRVLNGKRLPSEREQWYFARIKAELALKDFPSARRHAKEAAQEFPGRIDFGRWAALALEGEGDRAGAISEVESLIGRGRAPWYLHADLARMRVAIEDLNGAWEAACRSAEIPGGELSARVNLFLLLARISEARGDREGAVFHALLSARLREEQGWKLPDDLTSLLMRLPVPDAAPTRQELERLARDHRSGASAQPHPSGNGPSKSAIFPREGAAPESPDGKKPSENEEPAEGVVVLRFPEAPFAFINSPSFQEPVFVAMKDLPIELRRDGAEVRFLPVRSFDRKKNREGVRAVSVSPLSAAA